MVPAAECSTVTTPEAFGSKDAVEVAADAGTTKKAAQRLVTS
jgi:hypothetical protein